MTKKGNELQSPVVDGVLLILLVSGIAAFDSGNMILFGAWGVVTAGVGFVAVCMMIGESKGWNHD